jgi:thiol-disulfide isomerase/thioredoxin
MHAHWSGDRGAAPRRDAGARGGEVGRAAAGLLAQGQQGQDRQAVGPEGKVVLVDFWASWCKPCKEELPALDKLAKAYKDAGKDVVILAINIDEDKKNGEKFLKDKGIKHLTVLWDSGKGTADLYDPPTMPTSYIVNKKGIVSHVNQGYTKGDEKTVKKQIDALL